LKKGREFYPSSGPAPVVPALFVAALVLALAPAPALLLAATLALVAAAVAGLLVFAVDGLAWVAAA
jgi:hypothetical protein